MVCEYLIFYNRSIPKELLGYEPNRVHPHVACHGPITDCPRTRNKLTIGKYCWTV